MFSHVDFFSAQGLFILTHFGRLFPHQQFDVFDLAIPKDVPGVTPELLDPSKAWPDPESFVAERTKLANMFTEAFGKYSADCSPEVRAANPTV